MLDNPDQFILKYYSNRIWFEIRLVGLCEKFADAVKESFINAFVNSISFKLELKKKIEPFLKDLESLSKDELIHKVVRISSPLVFPCLQRYQKISPMMVMESKNIQPNVLLTYFRRTLISGIVDTFLMMLDDSNYINTDNDEIKYDITLTTRLQKYEEFFRDFYIYLINKYDHNNSYIFPLYKQSENRIRFNTVNRNTITDGGRLNTENNVREKIINMSRHRTVNSYDEKELRRLEDLLDNKKINQLIQKGDIKLSKEFSTLSRSILDKDLNEEEREKKFRELFSMNGVEDMKSDELYKLFNSEEDKVGFLEYFIQKLLHKRLNTTDNNDKDPNTSDISDNTIIISLADKVFDKIIKTDFTNNSLNLQDTDMKFILMLETLGTIRSNSDKSDSNKKITVNLFSDQVQRAEVDGEEITFK